MSGGPLLVAALSYVAPPSPARPAGPGQGPCGGRGGGAQAGPGGLLHPALVHRAGADWAPDRGGRHCAGAHAASLPCGQAGRRLRGSTGTCASGRWEGDPDPHRGLWLQTRLHLRPPVPCLPLQSFQTVTEDLKRRFAVNGEPLIDETVVGSLSRGASPHWSNASYRRQTGFQLPPGALPLSSSGTRAGHGQRAALQGRRAAAPLNGCTAPVLGGSRGWQLGAGAGLPLTCAAHPRRPACSPRLWHRPARAGPAHAQPQPGAGPRRLLWPQRPAEPADGQRGQRRQRPPAVATPLRLWIPLRPDGHP